MSNLCRVYIKNTATSTVFYMVDVNGKAEWRENSSMIPAVREAMWFDRDSPTYRNMFKEVADFLDASPQLATTVEVIVEDSNKGLFYKGDLVGLSKMESETTHIADVMHNRPEPPPVETPPPQHRSVLTTADVLDVPNEEVIDLFVNEFNESMAKGQWVRDNAFTGPGGMQYWKFSYPGTFNASTIAEIGKILAEGGWKILDAVYGDSKGAFIDGPYTRLEICRA